MAENVTELKPNGGGSLKTLGLTRALYSMFDRMSGFGRFFGNFNGRRDYNKIFGWDNVLNLEAMRYMYNRGGIAKRIVDAYPNAIWSGSPMVYVEEDTEDKWYKAFNEFTEKFDLWSVLSRLDKLAGLGEYAILLFGTNKGGLDTPLMPNSTVTFLQPYGQANASILQWQTDPTKSDFGMPLIYQITPQTGGGVGAKNGLSGPVSGPTMGSFRVHSSRVLHVANGNLEDKVYGQPRLAPVWDLLTDLRKVIGSSSESYWINANRGLQADVDKEMTLGPEDAAALSAEIQEFYDGLTRFVRTKGVKLNALENDIADPTGPFGVLVTLVAGATGIPKRILLGSEAGQLASSEDRGNWAERVKEERKLQTNPVIMRPLLARLIAMGVVPQPNGNLNVLWPDAYHMSPLERGQTQAQSARSIANLVKMFESKSQTASELLSREEARALIGLSTDNRILSKDPDI